MSRQSRIYLSLSATKLYTGLFCSLKLYQLQKNLNFCSQQLSEIGILSQRMKTGLDKLVEAEKSVNQLSKELAVKEKDLAVASEEADKVSTVNVIIYL